MKWNILVVILIVFLEFYALTKGVDGYCLSLAFFVIGLCINPKGVLKWLKKKR